ncbi:DEAD/DEAH box helicase [Aquimarina sp. ERC-38]|uniref:DEAD/DEAH box helicase n=1 Tax=Aquimarina sp. ERC-38 TaxID=2949996 RepID=UPI002246FFE0|nr:DEAD/DEAH box helicase [Aquimarina sp. ERC-38]UZO82346.1 DEAD/DEAH box helicase [Aquimarina sp. ERC-38]
MENIICYHLVEQKIPGVPPLPVAFLVSTKNEQLQYIEKQITETILSYSGVEYQNTDHEQLLNLCNQLHPIALGKRFQPKKSRKKTPLIALFLDTRTKEVILNFIIRKLTSFYKTITKNEFPLCFGAERNIYLETTRIQTKLTLLEPILQFTKTTNGINYAFTLREGKKNYLPKDQVIIILLNTPSYLLMNGRLCSVPHLNANKLIPFFTKEQINIPEKHCKSYLEKIIIPLLKNIEIQTEGFDIIIENQISAYTLKITDNFKQDGYVATVLFEYNHQIFEYHWSKTTASTIEVDHTNKITIRQVQRNRTKEKEIVQFLIDQGFQLNASLFLEFPMDTDPYGMLSWVKSHRRFLKEHQFDVELPVIDGKEILLATPELHINTTAEKDWFDIKGIVSVGHHQIPFYKFIPFIRDNNRHFPIDKETVFIIPLPWMQTYKAMATYGKQKGERFTVSKSNYTLLENITTPEVLDIQKHDLTDYQPSKLLKADLRPYQHEGVTWLIQHYQNALGACLADDMGLGKTLQTIAMLVYAKENLPTSNVVQDKIQFDLFSDPLEVKTYLNALIVLPSSLVFNWANEIQKFAPHFAIALFTGTKRKELKSYLNTYDVILTTYSILNRDLNTFLKFEFQYLVLDESQQIKNKESKIFQAINQVRTAHKISLSGTPIENSLSDLWSQMQFINPGMLGSFRFFKEQFKIPIEKEQDTERIKELKLLVDPFILRRTKEQVAKDLPKLSEQVIFTEMLPKQENYYETEKSAARNALLSLDQNPKNKIKILNTLMKLRQIANHPVLANSSATEGSGKFIDIIEFLTTLNKADKKALVFSSFVSHLEIYQNWCDQQNTRYTSLTGQTPAKKREQIVADFQEKKDIRFFFISLKAGGVGLNLTEASYVLLLDPWWNPFAEQQAIARAHRIGQTNNVLVTRFITKNSIEEKILKLQENKKQLSENIIDVNSIPEYVTAELEELLS